MKQTMHCLTLVASVLVAATGAAAASGGLRGGRQLGTKHDGQRPKQLPAGCCLHTVTRPINGVHHTVPLAYEPVSHASQCRVGAVRSDGGALGSFGAEFAEHSCELAMCVVRKHAGEDVDCSPGLDVKVKVESRRLLFPGLNVGIAALIGAEVVGDVAVGGAAVAGGVMGAADAGVAGGAAIAAGATAAEAGAGGAAVGAAATTAAATETTAGVAATTEATAATATAAAEGGETGGEIAEAADTVADTGAKDGADAAPEEGAGDGGSDTEGEDEEEPLSEDEGSDTEGQSEDEDEMEEPKQAGRVFVDGAWRLKP